MELSIDTKFLRDLTFQDERLLEELLDEWVTDAKQKMKEIERRMEEGDPKMVFNSLHELKTNFTMLHCGIAIRTSEEWLQKLERGEMISKAELSTLNEMLESIFQMIRNKQ